MPLIAPERCFEPYPVEDMQLPPGIVDENVPEQALRRQNDKIWGMSTEQQRKTISAYMASVRFMDEQVGRLLKALERLGAREETIVIFLSDHGYNLGEHKCWSKVSLWEGSVRVPMIISTPGYEENYGKTNESIVELIDLYPTLTELCGFSDNVPEILQGQSLTPIIRTNTIIRDEAYAYSVTYGGRAGAIRTEKWKYVRWGDEVKENNEELYDHHNDPEEHNNLVYEADHVDTLNEMRKIFEEIRKKANQKH